MSKFTFIWPGIEDETRETFAFGRKWEANVPQEIDEREGHTIEETERVDNPDGTFVLRVKKRHLSYVEMARNNPCFSELGQEKEHKRRGRPKKYPNAAEEHGGRELTIGE